MQKFATLILMSLAGGVQDEEALGEFARMEPLAEAL